MHMKAIVLAGGEGRRLQPYTFVLPKPLVPLGTRPVLEHLLAWLARNGISDVTLSVGYLAPLIEAYFASNPPRGIRLEWLREPKPLSTVGSLALLRGRLTERFLVVNGDTYTDLDLGAMTRLHRRTKAVATVAVHPRAVPVDLGVIEASAAGRMTGFVEKPRLAYTAAMGVNLFEPEVLSLIPDDTPMGFDRLILKLLARRRPVWVYRHRGFWYDIGRQEDYREAQEHWEGKGGKSKGGRKPKEGTRKKRGR
jgi:mannose-1-phosphate guanylyltransferase